MKISSFSLITAVGILTACGGGGGSTTAELSTSQFIDSPVKGLYYVTASGVTGTTDAAGTFQFKEGDSVTFKVGGADGLEIAATTPTNGSPTLVTELPSGQQIAQILQTFSTSDDPDAGLDLSVIEFTADQRTKLRKHITDSGKLDDFATGDLATIATAVTERVREKLGDSSLTFAPKAASAVTAHLEKTLAKPEFKPKALAGLKNKIYFANDPNSNDGLIGVMGHVDGGLKFLDTYLMTLSGSVNNLGDSQFSIKFDAYNKWGSDEQIPFLNCKLDFNVKSTYDALKTGLNGFVADYTVSTGCDSQQYQAEEFKSTVNLTAVDTTFDVKEHLLGKTLTIPKGELKVTRQSGVSTCGEIKLAFSDAAGVTVTTESDNACDKSMKFYDGGDVLQFGVNDDGTGGTKGLVVIAATQDDGRSKFILMGRSFSKIRFNGYANFTESGSNESLVPVQTGGGSFNYTLN